MIEYQVSLAGCECAVAEWNPQGSILVFALHGWLDNLASFESLVAFMPQIRVIAVDFPGHGHSAHITPNSAYHFIDGIYLIDDLMAHFHLKQINLLGHSMGGAISSVFSAAQSNKVSNLILIESLGPLTAESLDSLELLQKAINQRASLKDKRKPVYPLFEQALTARAVASQISKNLIKPIVERGLSHVDGGYTWRADSRLRTTSPIRMSEAQLLQILKNISAKVMLIQGSTGLLKDNSLFQARKKSFANLRVTELEGGHHVHLQHPRLIAEAIQSFLLESD